MALALAGCAHTLPPPSRLTARWAQFRFNAANNAVVPGTLQTAWSFESTGPISASPSVANGTLFIGNNIGRLVALDVRTGRELWHANLRNALMSAPLVIGNTVVVGEGNENSRVDRGVVHVGGGSDALVSLDRTRGTLRWRATVGGTAMPTPAYVAGRIVAHVGNGDLVVLSPETGTIAFTRKLHAIPSMVAILPLDANTLVTSGQTQTSVLAVDATTGGVRWRASFARDSALGDCPPVSDGARVMCDYLAPAPGEPYVKAGRVDEERAFALDARDGSVRWDVHLERGVVPRRNQAAIPLLDGGRLYLGSAITNAVHAIDPRNGRVLWRKTVGAPVKGGIVARDGVAYFGDLSGRLWALRERDGGIVGVVNAGTPFNVGSPIIVGKTLVIGSASGRVLALPLSTLRGARDLDVAPRIARRWFAASILTRFRNADRNHDGELSALELARIGYRDFDRIVGDRSGYVTPLEFATFTSPDAIKRPSKR